MQDSWDCFDDYMDSTRFGNYEGEQRVQTEVDFFSGTARVLLDRNLSKYRADRSPNLNDEFSASPSGATADYTRDWFRDGFADARTEEDRFVEIAV